MFCRACGFQLMGDGQFCPKCGNYSHHLPPQTLAPVTQPPVPSQVSSPEERLRKARVVVIVGCIFLAIVFASTLQPVAAWIGGIAALIFVFGWDIKRIPFRYKAIFVVVVPVLMAGAQQLELFHNKHVAIEAAARDADQARLREQQEEEAFNKMTPAQHLAAAQAELKVDATDQQLADATNNITALKGTSLESRGDALRARYEAQKAQADASAKAAEAKADAEAKAREAAYSRTRAGKLCAKHPDWTRDDCERVANDKIWIGMSLEMLEANRGRPDHANPSNYGNGTSWQWCWDDYTPSCFYGEGDRIITAYN